MEAALIVELRSIIVAFLALVPAVFVIHLLFRRPALRRLRLALTLVAVACSFVAIRRLAPTLSDPLRDYMWVVTSFASLYFVFKLGEVLLLDIFLPRRGQRTPPGIFRDIVSTIFAAGVLVILVQAGLHIHVAALVVTSAALSIFLGLALQQTLSDLFAGVAIVIERPFAPDDWVRIGPRVGRVREISWRAVKIELLRTEDYLIVPNSVVAKSEVVNMSAPVTRHGQTVEVGVAYRHPPHQVQAVLAGAAAHVHGVLATPPPVAELIRFDSSSMAYRVTFWTDDYARIEEIEAEVRAHIWYALRRHDIEIPYPIVHQYVRPLAGAEAAAEHADAVRLAVLFKKVDFLSALRPEDLSRLADSARIRPYPDRTVVVRSGQSGDSLFVVASGRVELLDDPGGGQPVRPIDTRNVGEYVGELALLTGAPYIATVRTVEPTELAVITADVLRPILQEDPAAAKRLSDTLAVHVARRDQMRQRAVQSAAAPTAAPIEMRDGGLLRNIQRFFGLREARD